MPSHTNPLPCLRIVVIRESGYLDTDRAARRYTLDFASSRLEIRRFDLSIEVGLNSASR